MVIMCAMSWETAICHFFSTGAAGRGKTTVTELLLRQASIPSLPAYFIFLDGDDDGLMETGERVVRANWEINHIIVSVLAYQAEAAAGDPMPTGDGETLAGVVSLTPLPGGGPTI